jgi:hypothetical protein
MSTVAAVTGIFVVEAHVYRGVGDDDGVIALLSGDFESILTALTVTIP